MAMNEVVCPMVGPLGGVDSRSAVATIFTEHSDTPFAGKTYLNSECVSKSTGDVFAQEQDSVRRGPVMTSVKLPDIPATPALLLVEPAMTVHSERATQLEKSCYRVTKADSPKGICLMKGVFSFSVAVLSDMIGFLALRASAQVVREQWPKARILVLGKVPIQFDDHLYDESVAHTSDVIALMAILNKVTEDTRNQTGATHEASRQRLSWAGGPQRSWLIQESDPTKAPKTTGEAGYMSDRPADGQLRRLVL